MVNEEVITHIIHDEKDERFTFCVVVIAVTCGFNENININKICVVYMFYFVQLRIHRVCKFFLRNIDATLTLTNNLFTKQNVNLNCYYYYY